MDNKQLILETPQFWRNYELLDCGDFEKLERFGEYVLSRPEPQAIWPKQWPAEQWKKLAHARFVQEGSHSGKWIRNQMPDNWMLEYKSAQMRLMFNLSLTSFKHVGIFPEQAANWEFIYRNAKLNSGAKVLNLFAYTGGASLAARAAGADVVHVDSVKQVISWAKRNMESSGLDNIRWTVEDAAAFVKREAKRGNQYHGIILDPPSYGIGAKGERWKLEENIGELMESIAKILVKKGGFLVFNAYSLGFSSLMIKNLTDATFPVSKELKFGELFMASKSGFQLPLGVFVRLLT